MRKVVFAVCEGPQDIAFLYRLFSADGFKTCNKKIAEFPGPISNYLKKSLEATDYKNIKLRESRQNPIPQEVLFKDNTLVLLYGIGGIDNRTPRKDMLKRIASFSIPPDDSDALDAGMGLQYTLVYFFDADDKGIKTREKLIKEEIYEVTGVDIPDMTSGVALQPVKGLRVGCYIFAKDDGYGKLEDILIPLMQEGNEEIFQNAAEFLKLKEESRLRKYAFDEKKSLIGISGQLQVSGKSNTVIIKDTDYINSQKINDNPVCRSIINFIRSL